jgi:hypothetical protein
MDVMRWVVRPLVVGGVPLILGGGCSLGDADFSTSTTATVKGKVTYQGRAFTSGKVVFNPANAKRKYVPAHEVPIGQDGTYVVTTLVGTNFITVSGPEVTKNPDLGDENITFLVKAGEQTFDIEFK